MVRIPLADFNVQSTVVGTPGVDLTTSSILGSVADALEKQRTVFQAAEQKKQEIAAESVATQKETQLLVEGLNPLLNKIKSDPQLVSDPKKASEYFVTEGQKIIDSYNGSLTADQQPLFMKKALGELQQGVGRVEVWSSGQVRDNAVKAQLDKADTLAQGARVAQSPQDFMLLYDKVPSLANAAVLGDSPAFEQKVKANLVDEYFYGNYANNPQRMVDEFNGPMSSLVSADKKKEYLGVAERRVIEQTKEKQDQQTMALLELTRAEGTKLMNHEISRVKWNTDTAIGALNGVPAPVTAFRNQLDSLIYKPEEVMKQQLNSVEVKLAQQTKVADLMLEWADIYSRTDNPTLSPSDIIKGVAAFYTKVGDALTKQEITKKQYDSLAATALKELNHRVIDVKGGGDFLGFRASGLPATIHGFREYAITQNKDPVQQSKVVQSLLLPYLAQTQQFETSNGRPPTEVESRKLAQEIKIKYIAATNPNLNDIPKEGKVLRDPNGRWLIMPGLAPKYLGR